MKSILSFAVLLALSTPAFATGTEVSYRPRNPFGSTLQFDAADRISDVSLAGAKLTKVSTLEKVETPEVCPGDDSYCTSTSSAKSELAVEIQISYMKPYTAASTDSSDTGYQFDSFFIRPSQLPAHTLAALQAKKHLGSKEAKQYFALKVSNQGQIESEIDNAKTQYCEEHQDGPLVVCPGSEVVYRNVRVQKTVISPVVK